MCRGLKSLLGYMTVQIPALSMVVYQCNAVQVFQSYSDKREYPVLTISLFGGNLLSFLKTSVYPRNALHLGPFLRGF